MSGFAFPIFYGIIACYTYQKAVWECIEKGEGDYEEPAKRHKGERNQQSVVLYVSGSDDHWQ
jgi:hypothetical protein